LLETRPAPASKTKPRRKEPPPNRAAKSEARRGAIVKAALAEFCARGFAATRIDDVAARAGVAKGTIYLHFEDKEALFREIVTTMLVPLVATLETPPPDLPIREVLGRFFDLFIEEIYSTERRNVLRLVMTEGPRFPGLAEFHYRNVVSRAIAAMRALLTRAQARGELKDDTLIRFPQLVVAPALVAIIWSGLFDRFAPLDVAAMMRAHLDLLLDGGAP
jgi:AcrR family transcriptional regulator